MAGRPAPRASRSRHRADRQPVAPPGRTRPATRPSLDPQEPAAAAVRKLVATELPSLVEGYRGVPTSLRDRPGATGRSADAQLVDGLTVIDGEVARMTEQLARGALDEVATQGRYLELKYREGL